MAKYGSFKYSARKYGSEQYLLDTTTSFKAAQAALNRAVSGLLIVNSHYKQYGDAPIHEKDLGGGDRVKLAQRFVAPKTFSVSAVEFLSAGNDGNDGGVRAAIQADNGSDAPNGTDISSGAIVPYSSNETRWRRVDLLSAAGLSEGSAYWIVWENSPSTNESIYGMSCGSVSSANGSSAQYTPASGSWTPDGTYCVMSRLVSSIESDNDVAIPDLMGFRWTRNRDVPSAGLEATISNVAREYSIGQGLSSFTEAGKIIKAYVGFDVSGTTQYYRVFYGETEDSPTTEGVATVKAHCLMGRLLTDKMTSENLGGQPYETMIQSAAAHAGITSFNLRATGRTSRAGITFQGVLASSIAEQVREATIDRMHFKNAATLVTKERNKNLIYPGCAVDYALTDDDFILDAKVEKEVDKMVNRVTVTNDESGETTTDGSPLNVGNYQTIGTANGTMDASVERKDLTVAFGSYACIYVEVSDGSGVCPVLENGRDCGASAAYGSVSLSILNPSYPNGTAGYDLTVKGCPISNAGTATVLVEKVNQSSVAAYGKYTDRIDNKVFAGTTDAMDFAVGYLEEKSEPLYRVKANCRGIVDLYGDDVISVTSEKTKLKHICLVTNCEGEFASDPPAVRMYLEAERSGYTTDSRKLLMEDGSNLLWENGTTDSGIIRL